MRGIISIMVWLMVTATTVTSQDITLTVDAPESVSAGQRFYVTYKVNSTDGQFIPPSFDPSFTVLGPQQSSSRNVQWINGKLTTTASITLTYTVVAGTPGTYTIPAAQFTTQKISVSSEKRELIVTAGNAAPPAMQGEQQAADAGEGRSSGEEIYMRLLPSAREVYAGEPLTVTLKLYSRVNLSGIQDLRYPDFRGFLKEEIETPPLRSLESEMINGTEYGTGVIQRFILYPQVAGELNSDPAEMTVLVQERTGGRNPFFDDPFFDGFFSSVSNVPRKITSQPLTIRVKPLPLPRPADFQGAVGSFTLESSLSSTEAALNDAVTLTLTLKGTGNLNLAGEPQIHFPQGIEKYDPKMTSRNSGTISGTKTFEYLLIPRNSGAFDIPPVSYTFFDPRQEKYVTLRIGGYTLNVTGTPGRDDAEVPPYIQGEDVKYLGHDIRYIRNGNSRFSTVTLPLITTLHYWLWFAAAVVLAAAILIVRREHIRRSADTLAVRNRRAAKSARRRLQRAADLLKSGRNDQVNAEVAKALWGYLSDKLRIPPSEITRERCYARLRERDASEEMITELDSILTATEYSQFAPAGEGESPAALSRRASQLIGRLDNVLD